MKKLRRNRKITPRFIKLVAALSMIAIMALTFVLTRLSVKYINSRNAYNEIAKNAVVITPSPTNATATNLPLSDDAGASPSAQLTTPFVSEVPIQIDWLNLKAMNKQIWGWLYCADTVINYPIAQTKNNTYYLTHNAKRKEDQAGALFMDYRNRIGSSFENLIVFGHRMKDGSMFGSLAKFADKSYSDQHNSFYLLTETQSYRIDVFACRTVRSDIKYFPTSFTSDETMNTYCEKAISQSYWQVAPQKKPPGAILITFATCSKYDFSDSPMLLVHGWAVPVD